MIQDSPRDLRFIYYEKRRHIMVILCDILRHGWQCLIQAWQARKGWMDGWNESYTAPFLSYFIFGQLFNSLWSLFGRSRCHRGGLLPQRDLLCHFQEQSCLLNPVLYRVCESWIFRSITKMFLYVGAAPNRVNQRRQFRIQPRSVKYLVSDDRSQEWDSVICAGWGTICGHNGAEFSCWYSAHHPLSIVQKLCSQDVPDAAGKLTAHLDISGVFLWGDLEEVRFMTDLESHVA